MLLRLYLKRRPPIGKTKRRFAAVLLKKGKRRLVQSEATLLNVAVLFQVDNERAEALVRIEPFKIIVIRNRKEMECGNVVGIILQPVTEPGTNGLGVAPSC